MSNPAAPGYQDDVTTYLTPFNMYLGLSYQITQKMKVDISGYVAISKGFINGYSCSYKYEL